ncbi:hypothetical protein AK812_SmicGene16503 [Symbiodinium microadriaticum]|uniref:RRM domain-containing protein n=1 Tax=Symbiodinium microadriaticum TaxID=2951 RepID=A0A1Q9E050_SYMMI|nr:hypothetical protein AK812_SmicGene16503 [Symbiodinium microadriaticum]
MEGEKGEKGSGKGYGKGYWGGFANEKKVWIGGLPEGERDVEKNKMKLKEHMAQAGECIFAEINRNGVGGAAFKNPEDVPKAVAMLNGSPLKVWIGGLPEGERDVEKNKKLKEHMAQAGECIFAEINRNGVGGAAFKNPEVLEKWWSNSNSKDVPKAVQMLNGSASVDVWQRKTPETPAACAKADDAASQCGAVAPDSVDGRSRNGGQSKVWELRVSVLDALTVLHSESKFKVELRRLKALRVLFSNLSCQAPRTGRRMEPVSILLATGVWVWVPLSRRCS